MSTDATNVFIALAATAFVILFAINLCTTKISQDNRFFSLFLSKKNVCFATIAIFLSLYYFVLPVILISSGNMSTGPEGPYQVARFVAYLLMTVVIFFFVIGYGEKLNIQRPLVLDRYDSLNVVLYFFMALIIFIPSVYLFTISNTDTENGKINLAAAVLGFLILIGFLFNYNNYEFGTYDMTKTIGISSSIAFRFVVAFCAWNFLTQIQTKNDDTILMFLGICVIVPMWYEYLAQKDFVMLLGMTYVLFCIIAYGISYGPARILPFIDNKDSVFTDFFNFVEVKITILIIGYLAALSVF